ncbi:MAG: HAMP domain-containing sensor histidine kinase [Phycisphaeraceae bacterium]
MPAILAVTALAEFASPWVTGLLAGFAVIAVGLLVVLLVVFHSIRKLRYAAERLARGDLSLRVEVAGPLTITQLGASLNRMAGQLQDRLATVVQQRNELTAVLSSMVEGVIAVDLDERILSLNPAAADMLRLDATRAIGRPIQEMVRNTTLQRFITQTLGHDPERKKDAFFRFSRPRTPDDAARGTVTAGEGADRFLQAQSAVLRDGAGRQLGAVVVLHDVTDIRRLEQIRSEFVANVSHEIRTPVSAVKAAVETMLDDPPADPEDSRRFLGIIARQADRLDAIVRDLLSLARIEQDADKTVADLTPTPLRQVLDAAVETCTAHAKEKRIRLTVRCDDRLHALAQAQLLEQAVVNLIDNAIKYSPDDSHVEVSGESIDAEAVIRVDDEGRGIEPDHLPRIFERFYRTDKARSRQLGGTGLGLSIVKHVAEAHGGRVSVDSYPGRGSSFAIHLRPTEAPTQTKV